MFYYRLKLRDFLLTVRSFVFGIGLGVLAAGVVKLLWDSLDAVAQNYFVTVGGAFGVYIVALMLPFLAALTVLHLVEYISEQRV